MAKPEYGQWRRWYWTREWRDRREAQLAAEPFCRLCARIGRTTPATVADHVEPHHGDRRKFLTGALQSLCSTCHSSDKRRAERGGSGLVRGWNEDGWPLDERHPWNGLQRGEGRVPGAAGAANAWGIPRHKRHGF